MSRIAARIGQHQLELDSGGKLYWSVRSYDDDDDDDGGTRLSAGVRLRPRKRRQQQEERQRVNPPREAKRRRVRPPDLEGDDGERGNGADHEKEQTATATTTFGDVTMERENYESLVELVYATSPPDLQAIVGFSPKMTEVIGGIFAQNAGDVMAQKDYGDVGLGARVKSRTQEIGEMSRTAALALYVDVWRLSQGELEHKDLLNAVRADDELRVYLYLARLDPAANSHEALAEAAKLPSEAVMETLLARPGVDATANNNLALRTASEYGRAGTVAVLLDWRPQQEDATVSSRRQQRQVDPRANSNECLMRAIRGGHADVVNELMDWKGSGALDGARVDVTQPGQRPIVEVCRMNLLDVAERMLSEWSLKKEDYPAIGAEDPDVPRAFMSLLEKSSMVGVLRIKHVYADPTTDDNQCLVDACLSGKAGIVELLLAWTGGGGHVQDLMVDPTVPNNMALIAAGTNNRTQIVRRLLRWRGRGYLSGKRVDPTIDDYRLFRVAKENNYTSILDELHRWRGSGDLAGKRAVPPGLRRQPTRNKRPREDEIERRLRTLTRNSGPRGCRGDDDDDEHDYRAASNPNPSSSSSSGSDSSDSPSNDGDDDDDDDDGDFGDEALPVPV